MQDNYETIARKLRNCEDFRGNSMSGAWVEGIYNVWSYNTLIADYKDGYLDEGEPRYWLDDTKYSTTTSRHQNLVRRSWGLS